jgi:hypothetical protein
MGRTAGAIANFFRLAFWPLAAAILVVLLLQPLYFLSLASLGSLTSRERTVAHLGAAFDAGILSDDGNPRVLIFKGGEQLTECISLGIGLNQAERPGKALSPDRTRWLAAPMPVKVCTTPSPARPHPGSPTSGTGTATG